MISERLRCELEKWAAEQTTIKALYVFGSYAKGTARPESDLDLAFEFKDTVDCHDAELIENAATWKCELTSLTGILVKDLYLVGKDDLVIGPERVQVFSR